MYTEQQPRPLIQQTPSQALPNSVHTLFPEQTYEEKTLQKPRQILGDKSQAFSSEALHEQISMIQFLVTSWLDEFEQSIFDGKTLNELLHEKGRV